MTPLALIPNSTLVVRPDRAGSEQATKPFLSRGQKRPTKITCLKPPAITALALALLILAAVLPQTSFAGWSPTGPLNISREQHTATLLPNGKVLVTGGVGTSGSLASAELYDQTVLGFSKITSPMSTGRSGHTATLLPNGKVLVVGGWNLDSAELYDPASVTPWSPAGTMGTPRGGHTATLLPNGKVLVAGGRNSENSPTLASAHIYDPVSGIWNTTAPMGRARAGHTATLLPNGRVLVVGGEDASQYANLTAELYNPVLGWTPTSDRNYGNIWAHTATLCLSGKVLVAGGQNYYGTGSLGYVYPFQYDPATGDWILGPTAQEAIETRARHTATLLSNGLVLLAGGYYTFPNLGYRDSAQLYNPAIFYLGGATGHMSNKRARHTATLLSTGKVLVAGGYNDIDGSIANAELYDPNVVRAKLPRLAAFYPLDGHFRDVSGNARHAQATGSPQPVPGSYGQGQAYLFNGAIDYLTAPLDINTNQYPKLTMGCWAKTASLPPWWQHQPLLTHDNDGFDRAIAIDWRANGFDLDGNPNAVGWSAFGGAEGQVLGAVPAILDQWTFLAVVYDQTAGTVKFQVDDMVFTKTGATLGLGRDKLLIGFRPGTSSFPIDTYFAGAIDNVFIFGDALTDEQLAYIRAGGAEAIMTAVPKIDPGILYLLLMD